MRIEVSCGDASLWMGEADIVCTNPYAPLPKCLWGKPSIISLYEGKGSRQKQAEGWIGGASLHRISAWGTGGSNAIYLANMPPNVNHIDVSDLVEDHEDAPEGAGWFPLALPTRLLSAYARAGQTVWDGYMGRGTVGKACQLLNMNFVGLDLRPERVDYAKKYLCLT